MCQVKPDIHESLIEEQGCRNMDLTKKLINGYIVIENEALQSQKTFNRYISKAIEFNTQAKYTPKKKINVSIYLCE